MPRLLNELRRRYAAKARPRRLGRLTLGPGVASRHPSGETMYTHPYHDEAGKQLGVARVIPRNDGRTLHVEWVGPETVGPGEVGNTVGAEAMASLGRQVKQHYPDAQFLTGLRGGGVNRAAPKRVVVPVRNAARKYAFGYSQEKTHQDFVPGLAENREDMTPSLVFADWLQEQGHSGSEEVVRRSVEHLQRGPIWYEPDSAALRRAMNDARLPAGHAAPFVHLGRWGTSPQGPGKPPLSHWLLDLYYPHPEGGFVRYGWGGGLEDTKRILAGMTDVPNVAAEVERMHLHHEKYRRRYAKVDGHVPAHPLVAGFPIEHALRHLANDSTLPSHVRDTAKTVLTGGPDRDGGMIPTGLWALGDQLEEIGHPLASTSEGGYNWRSAGDKVELDKHVGTAFGELAAAWRRQFADHQHTHPDGHPHAGKYLWHFGPEHQAQLADHALGGLNPSNSDHAILDYVHKRTGELYPTASRKDVVESIRRHAHRAQNEWNLRAGNRTSSGQYEEFAKKPYIQPWKGKPVGYKLNELAARYRRRQAPKRYSSWKPAAVEPRRVQTKSGTRVTVHAEPEGTTDRPAYTVWAKTDDGKVVGSGTIDFHSYNGFPEANLHPQVDPGWRRQGIASEMYRHAAAVAKAHGHRLMPTGGETDAAAGVWDSLGDPEQLSRRRYAKPFDAKPVKVAGFEPEADFFPEERSDLLGGTAKTQQSYIDQAKKGLTDKRGVLPGLSEVKALAEAGEPARGGYRETHRTVLDLLKNPVLADRFVTANAILSAQTGWEAHTAGAIEALAAHRAGLKNKLTLDQIFGRLTPDGRLIRGTYKGPDTYTGAKAEALKRLFAKPADEGGVEWGDISKGSYKTPNFGLAFVDPRGTPIDTHMGKLLVPGDGFDLRMMHKIGSEAGVPTEVSAAAKVVRDKIVGKTATHLAYKTLLAKAAADLGWEPREVQEAVWTATVAAMLSKHLGAGPKAAQILGKLNRRAVQAGWSLNSVLTNPEVVRDLEILGSSPRKIAAAIRASEKRTPAGPGSLRTGDPAALESAALRLPAERVKAAGPIAARLARAWAKYRRRVTRMARPDEAGFQAMIRSVQDNPNDATGHLVYADFLQDNGIPGAEVVRHNGNFIAENGRNTTPRNHANATFPGYTHLRPGYLYVAGQTPAFSMIRGATRAEAARLGVNTGDTIIHDEKGVRTGGSYQDEQRQWVLDNAGGRDAGMVQPFKADNVPGIYLGVNHAIDNSKSIWERGNSLNHWAHVPDLDTFHRLTADFPDWLRRAILKWAGTKLTPRKPRTPPPAEPPAQMARVRYEARNSRGDFIDALRRIRSRDMQALHTAAREAARDLGLDPVDIRPALHDTPQGSVPGTAQAVYGPASPERVNQAAAWTGLTGNSPGVAVFHVRPTGPDLLHKFRFEGSGLDLRHKMDRAGITNRVLMPHEKGFDVMIPDPGGRDAARVAQFVRDQRVHSQVSRGHFTAVGSRDQGDAREKYRNVVQKSRRPRRYAAGHTHAEFLRAIEANPTERTIPLAYADWHEDQGLPHTAAFLREHTAALEREHGNSPINWRFQGTGKYTPPDNPDAERATGLLRHKAFVGAENPYAVELWQRSEDGNHVMWKLYNQSEEQAHDWMARLASEGAAVHPSEASSPGFRRAVRMLKIGRSGTPRRPRKAPPPPPGNPPQPADFGAVLRPGIAMSPAEFRDPSAGDDPQKKSRKILNRTSVIRHLRGRLRAAATN